MGAALLGNHRFEPRIHPLRIDELTLAPVRQQLVQRRGLQRLGIGTNVPTHFKASGAEGVEGAAAWVVSVVARVSR